VTDAKLIRRNNTAVTMIFGQSAPWTVFLLPFLEQFDGNSCGPIACLKLMEIYRVITAKEIKASDKSYREIVFNHQARMVTNSRRKTYAETLMSSASVSIHVTLPSTRWCRIAAM